MSCNFKSKQKNSHLEGKTNKANTKHGNFNTKSSTYGNSVP